MIVGAALLAAGVTAGPGFANPAADTPPATGTEAQGAAIPNATVTKAGAALRDVMKVQEAYQGRIESAPSDDQKKGLATQANAEALQAINSKGLSVEDYTKVIRLARTDPQLKQKLLDAAR
jgi:hypothetical protein